MDNDRQQLLRGHIGRGAVLSFLIHASFVLPFVVLAIIFGNREAADRDLDVHFEDVSAAELPDNLPPIEAEPSPPEKQDKEKVAEEKPPAPEKPPEEQKVEVPVPQPRRDKAHEK